MKISYRFSIKQKLRKFLFIGLATKFYSVFIFTILLNTPFPNPLLAQASTEPNFVRLTALALEANGSLVTTDFRGWGKSAIVRIDAVTGERTMLSDNSNGNGQALIRIRGIAVADNGMLYVVDSGPESVVRVDPSSGNRITITDSTVGTGPLLTFPRGIAIEADGNIIVTDTDLPGLVRIDPVLGVRTILSDNSGTGAGPDFIFPRTVAVESDGNLVVVDQQKIALFRIDPVTGDRTIISDGSTGNGPSFLEPFSVAVESDGNLVVSDDGLNALFQVDPVTGDRIIISSVSSGTGTNFSFPRGIVIEGNGNLLVADQDLGEIFRVDPVTGDRTILSDMATSVEDNHGTFEIPQGYVLHQNYPNPFNPSTQISFSIDKQTKVKINVFDVLGRMIAVLINKEMTPGMHNVVFNANEFSSGTYFYRISAGKFTKTKKMILMR